MSTSAKLLSSQAIRSIANGGTTVSIEWAKQTTAWSRTYCAPMIQNEFANVVEANKAQLPIGTVKVAMKESEHQSDKDKRKHYTAFCKDKDGKDLPTQHFVKSL